MSKGNKRRRKELGLLPASVRCSARRTNGEPCKKYAINGGAVCASHGGAAPQVKRRAQERIDMAADDAASTLVRFLNDERLDARDRMAAAKEILNRAGIGGAADLNGVLDPWSGLMDTVVVAIVSRDGDAPAFTQDYAAHRGVPQIDNVVEAVVVSEEPA